MKKNDIRIIIIGSLLALVVYGGLTVSRQMASDTSLAVEVHMDGEVDRVISLTEDGVYKYEHEYGFNTFEVSDGRVDMIQADCPDLSCTRQSAISMPRENIVCLPYRFHLVIVGEEEVQVDAISK